MFDRLHPSWKNTVKSAMATLPDDYIKFLQDSDEYIPTRDRFLNAFSTLDRESVKYILFGQDPYPRKQSAIGYAFIDGGVDNLFGENGLSKPVNRATSLRNFIKTILVYDGKLKCDDTSKEAVASIDKSDYISTMDELRVNFERAGVLLLNTSLVFTTKDDSKKHIKIWRPFIESLLSQMHDISPTLILFGAHAKELTKLDNIDKFATIALEHPYNHTFICNDEALRLFGEMELLKV